MALVKSDTALRCLPWSWYLIVRQHRQHWKERKNESDRSGHVNCKCTIPSRDQNRTTLVLERVPWSKPLVFWSLDRYGTARCRSRVFNTPIYRRVELEKVKKVDFTYTKPRLSYTKRSSVTSDKTREQKEAEGYEYIALLSTCVFVRLTMVKHPHRLFQLPQPMQHQPAVVPAGRVVFVLLQCFLKAFHTFS